MGKTFGLTAVDWEDRVNVGRLRTERLARIKMLLGESELGALLCFDMNNIRYITATHIGTWAMDKLTRFSLLPRDDEPIVWDFGSAARHHEQYCSWLEGRTPAGISTLRGAMSPQSGRAEDVAAKIKRELEARGLQNEPLGVDVIEPSVLFALQAAGIEIADLPAAGRLAGSADRGAAGRHRRWLRGDHPLPGRGADGGGARALLHLLRPAARRSGDRVAPQSIDPDWRRRWRPPGNRGVKPRAPGGLMTADAWPVRVATDADQ